MMGSESSCMATIIAVDMTDNIAPCLVYFHRNALNRCVLVDNMPIFYNLIEVLSTKTEFWFYRLAGLL